MKNSKTYKKILITGSDGRIGIDLMKFLSPDYSIISINKEDKISEEEFKKVKVLIHLAAKTPRKGKNFSLQKYIESNVELTKKVLFLSSLTKIETIIIPLSWSWAFKLGNYQYSKLLQEKVINEYKKRGLKIISPELPEITTENEESLVHRILNIIKKGKSTTVDSVNFKVLKTKDFSQVCKKYIEGKDDQAKRLYDDSINCFNLYEKIKEILEKEDPSKMIYLKKGKNKIMYPKINKDKTIDFPIFEEDLIK